MQDAAAELVELLGGRRLLEGGQEVLLLVGDVLFDQGPQAGEGVHERWAQAHSAVKKQIDHLKSQEGAPLADAFETLRVLVQEHVRDEEKNLLPALADKATDQQLDGLGARILQAKQRGG